MRVLMAFGVKIPARQAAQHGGHSGKGRAQIHEKIKILKG